MVPQRFGSGTVVILAGIVDVTINDGVEDGHEKAGLTFIAKVGATEESNLKFSGPFANKKFILLTNRNYWRFRQNNCWRNSGNIVSFSVIIDTCGHDRFEHIGN